MASVLGALKRGFEALPLKGRGKSSRRSGLRPRRRPCGKAVGGVAPTYGVRGNSGQAFVGRQRQELLQLVGMRQPIEHADRLDDAAAAGQPAAVAQSRRQVEQREFEQRERSEEHTYEL